MRGGGHRGRMPDQHLQRSDGHRADLPRNRNGARQCRLVGQPKTQPPLAGPLQDEERAARIGAKFVFHDAGPEPGIALHPFVGPAQGRCRLESQSQRAVFIEPHRCTHAHRQIGHVRLRCNAFQHVVIAVGGNHRLRIPLAFRIETDRFQQSGRIDLSARRGHHLSSE